MLPSKKVIVGLAFVATSALTWDVLAEQPHSWCVTGAPLAPGGSPDPTTNQIIGNVCGQLGLTSCCATGGRWSLECVQRAGNYALVNDIGDVCGRYAWDEVVLGTEVRLPRDFNLVALSGNVSGIRDVEGSIATAGWLSAGYFRLNHGRPEETALFTRHGATMWDGEVLGDVVYDGNFSATRVTFLDGWTPGQPSQPFPIQFEGRQSTLVGMSNALATYNAVLASKQWSTLNLIGTDPELNVFWVDSNDLLTTYDYYIDVPEGASAIINVSGAQPEIKYAGFRGRFSAGKLLWNFPQATTLKLRSVGFPGSILAPQAAADMRDGSLRGTVVVASAFANVELYMAPFDIPSVGGCLAINPNWSCSADTKIDGTRSRPRE